MSSACATSASSRSWPRSQGVARSRFKSVALKPFHLNQAKLEKEARNKAEGDVAASNGAGVEKHRKKGLKNGKQGGQDAQSGLQKQQREQHAHKFGSSRRLSDTIRAVYSSSEDSTIPHNPISTASTVDAPLRDLC